MKNFLINIGKKSKKAFIYKLSSKQKDKVLKDYYYLMITGLLLSVFLVATLATYFANYIKDNKWLGYVGIFVIIIVALQLIIGGLVNLEILTIKEQYEFLFSV